MKNTSHFFILNKASDYEGGRLHHAYYRDSKLIVPEGLKETAFFLSKVYDTGEEGMIWHRMRIECDRKRAVMKLSIYSADDIPDDFSMETWREDISSNEIKDMLQRYLKKTESNQRDLLLHDVEGRYIWFLLEFSEAGHGMEISDIRLYFPKNTWMEFLPEVYEKSAPFLEPFLGIFESLYQSLDESIKYSFAHYQPDICGAEYLLELAKWIHMQTPYIWKEEQLRSLLAHNMELYRYRGTVDCLIKMVELYTGAPAYIIEQHKLKASSKENSLYGTNPYSFTLLIQPERGHSDECDQDDSAEHVSTDREYRALQDIVKDFAPAQMECNIVVLKPYLFLGQHTYLGLNSILGKYKPFDMKTSVMLPFGRL